MHQAAPPLTRASFKHCHSGHAMFFLVFLGTVSFSFINCMQMNQACRLVTISANHTMASVSAKFPVTASREFLEIDIFVVPLALNS